MKLLSFSLTGFMEQSLFWEANSLSASQEIPHLFKEPESSLQC
jgi:hypothetical protein